MAFSHFRGTHLVCPLIYTKNFHLRKRRRKRKVAVGPLYRTTQNSQIISWQIFVLAIICWNQEKHAGYAAPKIQQLIRTRTCSSLYRSVILPFLLTVLLQQQNALAWKEASLQTWSGNPSQCYVLHSAFKCLTLKIRVALGPLFSLHN